MSRPAFDTAAELIVEAEEPYRPQLVVGIERGGRELAALVAELMAVPPGFVRARHNDSDEVEVQATGQVHVDIETIERLPQADRILVVDDICGSGATLRAVTAAITGLRAPSAIRTAVLCRNAGADFAPDCWVWDVCDWVHFPWERDAGRPTEPLPVPERVR
ncbi:phosphoribosyltransferase [Plantactinospora sp. CA-290183]|uniref:phosphoribosyltransferase n=1 Tax=Plantactinospora sp. CA-290183 TaxID=3240006 RepID=UPI003D909219